MYLNNGERRTISFHTINEKAVFSQQVIPIMRVGKLKIFIAPMSGI